MPVVQKELVISAPADRIFNFVMDPDHLPDYAPGVSSVSDVKQTNGTWPESFKVGYSVLNLKFPMTFTSKGYRAPTNIDMHMDGNMVGSWQWRLAEESGGTRVHVSIDYKLKLGLLGKAMNALLVERMNEKNTEAMLVNLKAIMERN